MPAPVGMVSRESLIPHDFVAPPFVPPIEPESARGSLAGTQPGSSPLQPGRLSRRRLENMATFSTGDLTGLRSALRGQYSIERELGRGGMGVVFLARDERLDRPVALKVLPPALARDDATRARFLREARLAAQLSHPHIVPVYRADEIEDLAYFAMGYVDGETFGARIRDRGRLAAPETVRVLREVAWALAYAHARGIVHRDIKPENILLERGTGRAVVTDFGIARSSVDPSLTADGHVLGTVHFMSPEQCTGGPIDGRSDLYALGVTGYYALSGRLPFEDEMPQAVIVAHATRTPPPLRTVAPDVPVALADVIDRCLQKDPAARISTGEALADALSKALDAGDAGTAPPRVLPTEQAHAVWRRAAQLQAEAATRVETRLRSEAGNAGEPAPRQATGAGAMPTSGLRVQDVAAAAVEAGISQQYVALALAELERAPEALQRANDQSSRTERLATQLLGTSERTLSVTRTYSVPPRDALAALGRILQAPPYSLTLRDTLGGHPLDGGVLVFTLPAMVDETYKWLNTRYGAFAPEVRIWLRPVPHDPRACEVTMQVDLSAGMRTVLGSYAAIIAGVGAVGGAAGFFAGFSLLSLGAALAAVPAMGAALLAGAGMWAASPPLARSALRKLRAELDENLAAVERSVRARDIFGEAPPTGHAAVPRDVPDPFIT
jgi:eukaryotic-like serine/threonine-protein kinase